MTELVARFADDRRVVMRLGDRIGSGAVGDIHRLLGRPGLVAKLYRTPADRAAHQPKIADMIGDPPDLPLLRENGREYPQIAWPIAALHETGGAFAGFVMPEIDMSASTELENVLQRVSRRVRALPEFYGGRVLLAANLAALMAELHAHGHYVIDMKPVNIRFYPRSWYLAILDTDGFSVHGARWPARQFSDEYIAPEARGQVPEGLGAAQDLFALAVILFRLLNNGLHPYQGLDRRPNLPTTIQERVFAGLYAYGRTPSTEVRPAPSTLHDGFEDSTRELFDRAFAGDPAARPTAREWRLHLQALIADGVLRRCSRRPDEHMRFSRACSLCAVDDRRAATVAAAVATAAASAAAAASSPPTPVRPRGGAALRPRPPRSQPARPLGAATLGRVFVHSVAGNPRQVPLPPPPRRSPALGWLVVGGLSLLAIAAALVAPNFSDGTPPVAASRPSHGPPQDSRAQTVTQQVAALTADAEALCRSALSPGATAATANPADARWDDRPLSAASVVEARRRGETPRSCWTMLQARLRESAPASAPQFDQLSLAELCRVALAATVTATSNVAQATWDDRPFVATYVQEAQRRGQTAQSCAVALRGQPEVPR